MPSFSTLLLILSKTYLLYLSFSNWIYSTYLVWHRQLREIRDVSGPLHGAEEKPGSQFTDVINPHGVIRPGLLVVLVSVPAAGVRLGSQQLRNELRHRLTSATSSVVVIVIELAAKPTGATYGRDGGAEAWLRWDATALNCCSLVGGQRGGDKEEKRRGDREEMKAKGMEKRR